MLQSKLCPVSVYEYPCDRPTCEGCQIMIEAQAKESEDKEDKEIADNMRSYWANLNAGSAR